VDPGPLDRPASYVPIGVAVARSRGGLTESLIPLLYSAYSVEKGQ
jgi:hypothetical protein